MSHPPTSSSTSSSTPASKSQPKPHSTTPASSIPGYKAAPILNGPRKAYLACLIIIPVGAYFYLQSKQQKSQHEQKVLEDEGRKNWLAEGADRAQRNKIGKGEVDVKDSEQKDLSVRVGRSGGGV